MLRRKYKAFSQKLASIKTEIVPGIVHCMKEPLIMVTRRMNFP